MEQGGHMKRKIRLPSRRHYSEGEIKVLPEFEARHYHGDGVTLIQYLELDEGEYTIEELRDTLNDYGDPSLRTVVRGYDGGMDIYFTISRPLTDEERKSLREWEDGAERRYLERHMSWLQPIIKLHPEWFSAEFLEQHTGGV